MQTIGPTCHSLLVSNDPYRTYIECTTNSRREEGNECFLPFCINPQNSCFNSCAALVLFLASDRLSRDFSSGRLPSSPNKTSRLPFHSQRWWTVSLYSNTLQYLLLLGVKYSTNAGECYGVVTPQSKLAPIDYPYGTGTTVCTTALALSSLPVSYGTTRRRRTNRPCCSE